LFIGETDPLLEKLVTWFKVYCLLISETNGIKTQVHLIELENVYENTSN